MCQAVELLRKRQMSDQVVQASWPPYEQLIMRHENFSRVQYCCDYAASSCWGKLMQALHELGNLLWPQP